MISEADSKAAAAELEAAALTKRERDVLILTAKGLTAEQIGALWGRSMKTVELTRCRMRQKVEMTTIEAVVLAVKAGWV